MFAQYFTYWDDLQADSGFPLFGTAHILWLAGIAAAVVLVSALYLRCGRARRERILKILGLTILMMEAYKETTLAVLGHMELQYVPLQLCGIAIFAEAAYIFFPCSFLGEVICVACLPGALSALLFPDWTRYPTINFMNLHSFIMHGILILIPILVMISGKYKPQLRRIYMPLLFFAAAVPVLYRLNIRWDTNFMFLHWPSLGSPFDVVYRTYGYGAYLAAFAATTFAVILLMYGILALCSLAVRHFDKRRRNSE